MSSRTVDVKEFAERVERMCEFILNQIEVKDGSHDTVFIQDLKKDAADIQSNPRSHGDISLIGLDKHIRGIIKSE